MAQTKPLLVGFNPKLSYLTLSLSLHGTGDVQSSNVHARRSLTRGNGLFFVSLKPLMILVYTLSAFIALVAPPLPGNGVDG